MWDMIAKEMELPWRAVESMHWQMGQEDLASRANVPVFQSHIPNKSSSSKSILPRDELAVGLVVAVVGADSRDE